MSVLSVPLAWAEEGEGAVADRLIEFSIRDQFDRPYTRETFAGNGLVVIAGDRVGSRYVGGWGKAIREGLAARGRGDDYRMVGLSDLGSVPGFLRNTIRKRFPQDEAGWVLMDWEGVFAATYGFEKKHCTLLAFSTDGKLILRRSVEAVDSALASEVIGVLAPEQNAPEQREGDGDRPRSSSDSPS